jgi:hypothetical protein
MSRAKDLSRDGKRPAEQLLCFGIPALRSENPGQLMKRVAVDRVARTERTLNNGKRPAEQLFCFGIPALTFKHSGQRLKRSTVLRV